MNEKITRRQALLSLAAITAGTMITTRAVSGARPVKTLLRFPVGGDSGTGGSDQIGIPTQMVEAHRPAPCDFAIAACDNSYRNGSARDRTTHSEQPVPGLLT